MGAFPALPAGPYGGFALSSTERARIMPLYRMRIHPVCKWGGAPLEGRAVSVRAYLVNPE